MYRKQVRRRRAVLVGLIVLSLVLISAHFTEAESGPLHAIQRATATALSPLEEIGSQALKPARDAINWFDETFDARGENEELRAEVASLRAQLAQAQAATGENEQLRSILAFNETDVLAGYTPAYEPVTTRVVARSSADINSTVTVGAGSSDGVEIDDPVVTGDGLVGRVLSFSGRFATLPDKAPELTTLHLLHGEDDRVVPVAHARAAYGRLAALGGDATLDVASSVAHQLHPALVERAIQRLQTCVPLRSWKRALDGA